MKANSYPESMEGPTYVSSEFDEATEYSAVDPTVSEYTGADDAGDALSVEQVTLGTYGGPYEDVGAGFKG